MRKTTIASVTVTSLVLFALCVAGGCNTVKGAGEDIKATGQAGENVIKKIGKDEEK